MPHLFQGRGDQAGQADDIHVFFNCCLKYGFGRYHDTKVNHLVMITAQHYADDVFSDVVHVTLDGRHQDTGQAFAAGAGLAFFLFDIRNQYCHGLFHDTCAFDYLWQKHAPVAKQVADHVHAIHQRTFNDIQCLCRILPGFLGVFLDESIDTFNQSVF